MPLPSTIVVQYLSDDYRINYTPGSPGSYLDPPEGPEVEIISINDKAPNWNDWSDEQVNMLYDELAELAEEYLASMEEDHG